MSLVELLQHSETGSLTSDDWLTRLLSATGLLEELRLSLLFSLDFSFSDLWLDEDKPFRFLLRVVGLLQVFCFSEGGSA